MTTNMWAKCLLAFLIFCSGLVFDLSCDAQQIDIAGPSGSGAFGTAVAVLPNGNIVVTDPNAGTSNQGAVYLYSPRGTLISTLNGSTANDHVGLGYTTSDGNGNDVIVAITVLTSGNFVVSSPNWNNNAGAVTWMNGNTGLSGVVSAANSLIGSSANDYVGSTLGGSAGVTELNNGNYIVLSPQWNATGATTWANGTTGVSGPVSAANSLVGGPPIAITALTNGNYVVVAPSWNGNLGAATWANGTTGLVGTVSAANSLTGANSGDLIGEFGVTALVNGNYVVDSPYCYNVNLGVSNAGAVTWANGSTGLVDTVSTVNSLVGKQANDLVGVGRVLALSNGNYVVSSYDWANGPTMNAGAVTWANGTTGLVGTVSATNSLVGTNTKDQVGYVSAFSGSGIRTSVVALSNGNYVVPSSNWSNGQGAATWGNGSTGVAGAVSVANSLVGTQANTGSGGGDNVGDRGVTALSNGNYVVSSHVWNNGATQFAGAVTWANGSTGLVGTVSATNSLVGTLFGDEVGYLPVTALSNGNYVVSSPFWNNRVGAATWADGSAGLTEPVSIANSLVGSTSSGTNGDFVSGNFDYATNSLNLSGVAALPNGNYVVASSNWSSPTTEVGAVTWANGRTGLMGTVSASNSLIGTTANDHVGFNNNGPFPLAPIPGITPLLNGGYVTASSFWTNGSATAAGAMSLGRGGCRGLTGTIGAANSVRGTTPNGGTGMVFDYDATRDQLVVGQKWSNIISLFRADEIFACGFE